MQIANQEDASEEVPPLNRTLWVALARWSFPFLTHLYFLALLSSVLRSGGSGRLGYSFGGRSPGWYSTESTKRSFLKSMAARRTAVRRWAVVSAAPERSR